MMMVVIIIDIIRFHIVFALQSQNFMTSISPLQVESDYTQII